MINLIPPAGKAWIVREYWTRVIAVWLFLFGTVCLLVAALLLPTYVLIHYQIKILVRSVDATAEKVATFDASAGALVAASNQAAILVGTGTTTPTTWYVEKLETLSGTDVSIRSFDVNRQAPTGSTITITGEAATRQSLANFRDELTANANFSDVNLPIGNLIQDRNVLFSMKVTLATSTPSL
jgi:hypothetical protein